VSLASGIDGSAGRHHYERLFADMIRDRACSALTSMFPGAIGFIEITCKDSGVAFALMFS